MSADWLYDPKRYKMTSTSNPVRMNQTLVSCGHRKVRRCTHSSYESSLCESSFSDMIFIQYKHRTRRNDAHLQDSVRVAFTFYLYIQQTVQYSNSCKHSYVDDGGCHARCRPAHQEQFWGSEPCPRTLRHADQGNETNDLPITATLIAVSDPRTNKHPQTKKEIVDVEQWNMTVTFNNIKFSTKTWINKIDNK